MQFRICRGRRAPLRPSSRPVFHVEALEERTLPSANPTIDLSSIQLTGSAATDNILVQFRSAALTDGTVPVLPGTTVGEALPLVNGLYQINLNPGVTVAAALQAYAADPNVLDAEPDYDLGVSMTPNDPSFSLQTNLGSTPSGINATTAWNTTTGSSAITVAVLDTGVDYNHPDLYQNIWINQAEIPTLPFAPGSGLTGNRKSLLESLNNNGQITFSELNNAADQGLGKITDINGDGRIDAGDILAPMQTVTINGILYDTGKGGWAYTGNTQDGDVVHPNDFIGWNFVTNTNNPMDDNGHGTHVAGILGAVGNNGIGVAGVDWNAQIMPVKWIASNGSGSVANFISALYYSINHGAKISNNSWTATNFSQSLYDAVAAAQQKGQIFVAAAGNSGTSNDTSPTYPASLDQAVNSSDPALNNVVAVAATNGSSLASFSNYGPNSVQLAAPGTSIYSTWPGGGYAYDSGTSMATPEVAGVLALVWGEHPTWTYTQVINQVLSTVDKVSWLTGKVSTGGVLDAAAAVALPTSSGVTGTQLLDVKILGTTSTSTTLQIDFTASLLPATVNASTITLVSSNGTVYRPTYTASAGASNKTFYLVFGALAPGNYTLKASALVTDKTNQPIVAGALPVAIGTGSSASAGTAGTASVSGTTPLPIPPVSEKPAGSGSGDETSVVTPSVTPAFNDWVAMHERLTQAELTAMDRLFSRPWLLS
jgi:subtilisin family serine protease